ncbi:FecR domain-containing protein [Flagellatimonas centrodinii]|uniref:FecR family protein n=1 Tax=Flagellatimonas centrodinii TaxID=2806210 RepID=UPI001FED82D6|nr:FecR domain-containing protein [Flagellatimonas centrodinii]ULQ45543.1 FecR domain-containing protein [Flagellatimonas centrodinii]
MASAEHLSTEERARLTRAWDWVLRLRGEAPSQDELNDWLVWYESDPRNKQAFDQASAIASQAPAVAKDLRGALAPSSWRQPAATSERRRQRRRRAWLGAALAAGLGVVALQFGLELQRPMQGLWQTLVAYTQPAATPPMKRTVLPDGSQVDVATQSSVQLQYTDTARLLTMADGIAYFTVAHNKDRPFIVRAGNFYVRAVGTAFNVRHAGGRMVVTVTEGTVDVYPVTPQREPAAPPPADALRVEAGREVVWANPDETPAVAAVDPSRALAWREGRLEYLNEPLASAIADINRYASRTILIRDPAVGRLVFSGAVLTDSADVWVQSLPSLFPVDLYTDVNGNIVLVSRKSSNG